jgi:hypothetical protein
MQAGRVLYWWVASVVPGRCPNRFPIHSFEDAVAPRRLSELQWAHAGVASSQGALCARSETTADLRSNA